MNRKAIDEILREYPFIGDDIKREQEKLNEYHNLSQNITVLKAQTLTGAPHLPIGNTSDPTAEAVEKLYDDYIAKIVETVCKINELMDRQKWLDKAFATLTEDERRIIYLKYDERWPPYRIMHRLGIEDRHTLNKILDSARDKIGAIMLK